MSVASVLVCGGGIAGAEMSLALARHGLEVSFVAGAQTGLEEDLRAVGIEVRAAELIGVVTVDRHVEAELSDGHVENYDAVVVSDADAAFEVVVSDGGRQADLVTEIVRG